MPDSISGDFPSYPKNGVYLDSMTVGLLPRPTIDAMTQFNADIGNIARMGIYEPSRAATSKYYRAKESCASFFGGKSDQYAWIPNADFGWNLVLNSLVQASDTKLKVLTSLFDHHSILAPIIHLHKLGLIDVNFMGTQEEYNLEMCVENFADEQTVVALGHISPLIGLYRNIESIASCAKSSGATVAIDYSRTAGQQTVSLNHRWLDVAVIDGSMDLLGPLGSGVLYFDEDTMPKMHNPFPSSGNVRYVTADDIGQMRSVERFEIGNPNVPAMVGLESSMRYLTSVGKEKLVNHRAELMDYLVKRLAEVPDVNLVDPLLDSKMGNKQRASTVCFTIGDLSSHDVALMLDEADHIAVRSGKICTHPGLFALELEEVVQVSTHFYNSHEDVDRLITGLQTLPVG